MKSMVIAIMLALAVGFAAAESGRAAAPPALMDPSPIEKSRLQTACPVKGGKINKNLYVDYQGQRVYFCCPECIPIFKSNPEAFLQKMREQGVVPEKAPAGK